MTLTAAEQVGILAQKLANENAALRAELAEYKQDADRINYIEKHMLDIDSQGGWEEDPPFRVINVSGNRNDREFKCIGRGHSIREAIDAAMGATECTQI